MRRPVPPYIAELPYVIGEYSDTPTEQEEKEITFLTNGHTRRGYTVERTCSNGRTRLTLAPKHDLFTSAAPAAPATDWLSVAHDITATAASTRPNT